MVVNSNIDGL